MLKLGLGFLLFFASVALAANRYPIVQSVTVVDKKNHEVHLDASYQVSFEIESVGEVTSEIRLFNHQGEDAGVYSVSADVLQQIINKRLQSDMKKITQGSQGKQPDCCDVLPPPKMGRDLAVVENPPVVTVQNPNDRPGRVVGIPIPRQKPVRVPIPKQKPKRVVANVEPDPVEEEEVGGAGICKLYQKFKAQAKKQKMKLPDEALMQALSYYEKNPKKLGNKDVISIADYSANSMRSRFFILDMEKGTVRSEKVSHGGSGTKVGDPNHDGQLDACKRPNGIRTNLTRAGFFRTGKIGYSPGKAWPKRKVAPYKNPKTGTTSKYQNYLEIGPLSPGVNDDAFGYVMHEAKYNRPGGAIMGRSHGCPAFIPGEGFPLWDQIKGGSLYYSYAPVCKDDHRAVLKQIPKWKKFCR